MSTRIAAIAALAIMAGALVTAQAANARPDEGFTVKREKAPLARTDLERGNPDTRQRRQAPKPSAALRQRELIGRAFTIEFQTWAMISNSYDPDVYARYVASFPRGLFAPLARARAMYLIERRDFERSQLGVR